MEYKTDKINILSQYDFLKQIKDIENEEELENFTKKRFFNSIQNVNSKNKKEELKNNG
ncbi:hypothetical protein SAMN02745164_01436 [Marinitoga hydrogenitolerans DSM 16785]|uniref:Uncharacterized protein n=1 Tax=Marinitoga hydrogenitolerans (strain DSM 16785 / JCM 12826 / AT1271) TaxID=1122195 RepID=A0A1M4XID8_MARH1|nr:hypothetical protein [Marinitoga hydrogenitolerans]SHE93437.1 hypothetical protein SAMN02745164_01436 [Marinitoga hydrogenitolerans DSM 16785]